MTSVARVGDVCGGILLSGSPNVSVNGSGVVRIGDIVQSHDDSPHGTNQMITGSPTVFANGIPLSKTGDSSACGHRISTGSSNVFSN
jgi:uncharacterized Zn-binding protein involved in type VI secretion